jgi:hypothetical protein
LDAGLVGCWHGLQSHFYGNTPKLTTGIFFKNQVRLFLF